MAPEDARAFADRATCYLRAGRSAAAEKDFQRAARFVRDDQPEVIERLAEHYLRNGRGRQAARLLDRAVGRPGASLDAWCLRARALMALQRPAEAMQDVQACLKLSPSYPPAWQIKAELHLAMDEPGLARTAALVLRDLGGDLTLRLKELADENTP
jgi:tetratricopeptide (TPR) repeat protein